MEELRIILIVTIWIVVAILIGIKLYRNSELYETKLKIQAMKEAQFVVEICKTIIDKIMQFKFIPMVIKFRKWANENGYPEVAQKLKDLGAASTACDISDAVMRCCVRDISIALLYFNPDDPTVKEIFNEFTTEEERKELDLKLIHESMAESVDSRFRKYGIVSALADEQITSPDEFAHAIFEFVKFYSDHEEIGVLKSCDIPYDVYMEFVMDTAELEDVDDHEEREAFLSRQTSKAP